MMKSILISFLMGVAVLLGISSCATVPTEPLGPGELRLLRMEVPENGNLILGLLYSVNISFEADGNPEIIRACCTYSGDGPYCYRVKDIKYGSPGNFSVQFSNSYADSQRLECYAEYVRDGKRRRTNAVLSHIFGLAR